MDDDILGFSDAQESTEGDEDEEGGSSGAWRGPVVATDVNMLMSRKDDDAAASTRTQASTDPSESIVEVPVPLSVQLAPPPPQGMELYYWGTGRRREDSGDAADDEDSEEGNGGDYPPGGKSSLRWTRPGAQLDDGCKNFKAFIPRGVAPSVGSNQAPAGTPLVAIVTTASGAVADATELLDSQASRKRRRVDRQSKGSRAANREAELAKRMILGGDTNDDDFDDFDDMDGDLVAPTHYEAEVDAIEKEEEMEADDLFQAAIDAPKGASGRGRGKAKQPAVGLLGRKTNAGGSSKQLFGAGSPQRYLRKGKSTRSTGGDVVAAMDEAARATTLGLMDDEEDEMEGEDMADDEVMQLGSATGLGKRGGSLDIDSDEDEDEVEELGAAASTRRVGRAGAGGLDDFDEEDEDFGNAGRGKGGA